MKKMQSVMTIAEKERLAQDIFRMRLRYDDAFDAAGTLPGQFVGVYVPQSAHMLPRPISICDHDPEEHLLTLVFRAAGEGTALISGMREGEELRVLGILGNGYSLESLRGKKVALMGGGIGIPPMLYLAKRLQGIADVTCYLGYRDSATFLLEDFNAVCRTVPATEDGSVGVRGNVMDALEKDREAGFVPEAICACGPMPMLRAIKAYAADTGTLCYLSLEERMACGVGACLGCVCRTTEEDAHFGVPLARVCTDGPVFEQSMIEI